MANKKARKDNRQQPTTLMADVFAKTLGRGRRATSILVSTLKRALTNRKKAFAGQKKVAVICLSLILSLAAAMVGAATGRWFRTRSATSASMSPTPQGGALTLAKEYIYGPGGRMIATEEPAGPSCSPTIAPTTQNFVAAGGSGVVNVTAVTGCTWTATSNNSFITITLGSSGSGNGSVNYSVAANTGTQRNGTMTIAGQTFTVTQDAAGGSNKITPVSVTASNFITGNEPTKAIDGDLSTFWNSGGIPPQWIQLDLGQSYSVTQIRLNVRQTPDGTTNHEIYGGPQSTNLSPLRVLSGFTQMGQWLQADFSPAATNVRFIKINTTSSPSWVAWNEIEVYGTPGGGCSYSLNKTSQQFSAAGGTDNVSVTAGTNCPWTATTTFAWIHITGGQSGSGNGIVSYSVDPNTGGQRFGTITIAGQTFTVNQDSGCAVGFTPTNATVAAGGVTGNTISVSAGATCSWTATSNASWITINSGSSGTGNGTVNYSVASNPNTSQRTGTITIAGQAFTVTQLGSGGGTTCDFVTMSPSVRTVSNAGGAFTVSVGSPTPAGCSWTATSNVSWITITSGGSGTGAGTISYAVAPYSGGTSTRSGKITINSNSTPVIHTVKQNP